MSLEVDLICRWECAICRACFALIGGLLGQQPPDRLGRTKAGRCQERAQVPLPAGQRATCWALLRASCPM